MTATPGQPPALYARWHRVDTGPGTSDEMIAENWRVAYPEDREFWTQLDAERDKLAALADRLHAEADQATASGQHERARALHEAAARVEQVAGPPS